MTFVAGVIVKVSIVDLIAKCLQILPHLVLLDRSDDEFANLFHLAEYAEDQGCRSNGAVVGEGCLSLQAKDKSP